jgi:acetyl esterase/lipase
MNAATPFRGRLTRALVLLLCASCLGAGATMQQPASRRPGDLLTPDNTIGDVLNHPAFAGFGRLLLPWDDRTYDSSLRLRNIDSLLPYHSHVDPRSVVNGLNHMIDDISHDRRVFYDFYTPEQKNQERTRANTGLFFFRGKPGAPFAIISPGGGFSYVGSVHEGFPYAVAISKQGYNAFVLKYRAGAGGGVATRDLAAATAYVFRNSNVLGVGTNGYSLWGSSAGARMAASIGSHGVERFGERAVPKPSTVVIAYTGHADYSAHEPATFAVVGERDGIAPPAVMQTRIEALRKAGTTVELHRYADVGHGFGPGIGTRGEGWIDRAIRFWEKAIERSGK